MGEKAEKIRDGIIGPTGSARGSGGLHKREKDDILIRPGATSCSQQLQQLQQALGVVAPIYLFSHFPSFGRPSGNACGTSMLVC